MFPFYVRKQVVSEAGKSISADNLKKIQSVHDTVSSLGAACGLGGGMYESNRGTDRATEAALPMNTSHDSLRGHLRKALMTAHSVDNTYDSMGPWISDVFPQHVVYSHNGDTLKRKYSVEAGAVGADPKVTLGDSKKVHVAYVDSASQDKESMRVLTNYPEDWEECRSEYLGLNSPKLPAADTEGVIITLADGEVVVTESGTFCAVIEDIKEAAKAAAVAGKPTTIPVKIIGPGWGSMAYYSPKMIRESGPKVFRKGTQMFWNHATATQEAERPEGNLNDLAAVLTKDAYWDETGIKGPGLYSEAKVFSDYADQVQEKGPHIGVSINAGIKAHEGEAEGKRGRIADSFLHAFSTDFVTKAGAGGAPIVAVTESARPSGSATNKESTMLTAEQEAALRTENETLRTQVASMKAQENKIVAIAAVGKILKEAGVQVKLGLLERVCESSRFGSDGKLDQKWADEVAGEFVSAFEGTGRVSGLGDNTRTAPTTDAETTKNKESLKKSLTELGISEAGLEYALY